MTPDTPPTRLQRRAILKNGTLVLTAASLSSLMPGRCRSYATDPILDDDGSEIEKPSVSVGLVTDLHYADKVPAGTRHYRETLQKLDEAAGQFERDEPDFLVELGDLIDAADSVELEKRYLKTINREFSSISKERHYVLGNHCVDTLTKEEFLGGVGQAKSYYSFDRGGVHFVVLDSCFRSDGQAYQRKNFVWTDANVPASELEWLKADLSTGKSPVVVFAHQRLDVRNNHGVKNNADVRKVFEESGRVQAVFQGHSHKNDVKQIGGIHYCTLVAMVEGSGKEQNGYSLMNFKADGTITLTGFRKQQSREWNA